MTVGSTPLDDFLSGAGSSTSTGETLQRVGVVLGAGGVIIAVGLLVFVGAVWRGRAADRVILLRLAAGAGVIAAVGGVIEVAGVASILDIGWDAALADRLGRSGMMRLVGGALVAVGLVESVGRNRSELAGAWQIEPSAFFSLAGAAFSLLAFGFDGHTATEGPRVIHALVNAVHLGAAGVWAGGLVGLAIVAVRGGLRGEGTATFHRFASAATVAIVVVGVAGIVMAWWVLDSPGGLTSTDWGRILLVKTGLVAIAGAIGAHHHFRVLPRLSTDAASPDVSRQVNVSLGVEAGVLVVVALASGVLATASTV